MSFNAFLNTGMRALLVLALIGTGMAGSLHGAYAAPAKDVKIENPAKVVNVNTATTEELQTIPGIGPATAGRILEYRKEFGKFDKVEDLVKVRGIGEAKMQRIKTQVSI